MTSIEDLRGDIIIKGLFEQNQDCIIDVRVTDTDAPSYRTRNPYSVIKSQEAEKKKKYLRPCLEQRRTFVLFVVSVDGLIRKGRAVSVEANHFASSRKMEEATISCFRHCSIEDKLCYTPSNQLLYSRFEDSLSQS